MSLASSPSLRVLSATVILPLLVLAIMAWAGSRSQIKAAWSEAREEAERQAGFRSTQLAERLKTAIVCIPNYPDPPVPGEASDFDAILDSEDINSLLKLRDNTEAGISPAGLPRQALAALRLDALDSTVQKIEDIRRVLISEFPSVITSVALQRIDNASVLNWTRAEQARQMARELPVGHTTGHWLIHREKPWWVQQKNGAIHYIQPETLDSFIRLANKDLPRWAQLKIITPSGPIQTAPSSTNLAQIEVPFGEGLVLSVAAEPAILEKGIRSQQRWTFATLMIAVITAGVSLFMIHRSVIRERRLAAMKSQFVSSVSHELRAPLGSIRLMAEALEQGKTRKPSEFHRLIAREGARLSHLVENVLDFSRIEDGRKLYHYEECDISALIESCLLLMTPPADERAISFDTSLETISAEVDPASLEQAVINLLDNAIKFSPKNSQVRLSCLRQERSRPDQAEATHFQVVIADQGPGIPTEEHERIFERFYRLGDELRRECQGTGIGLSIVKHIATAHHGTINVKSTPAEGTSFTLTLPIKQCVS